MKKQDITKIFLFFTLIIVLIGITSAVDVESNDISTGNSQEIIQDSSADSIGTEISKDDYDINKTDKITKKESSSSSKTATKITINEINQTHYTDNVTITGNYKDVTGRVLRLTILKLDINNKAYYTKTNFDGEFAFNYKTNIVGTNNVSISFVGNDRFESTTSSTSFKVIPQTTIIHVKDTVKGVIGEKVDISGKFTDKNDKIIRLTPILVNVDGNKYYTTTDNNGNFKINYSKNDGGIHKLSLIYPGNVRYAATESNVTVYFVAKQTNIKANVSSSQNSTVISGKLTDNDGNILRWTSLKVTINNQDNYIKTTDKGEFTYTYSNGISSINDVFITFMGTSKYMASTNHLISNNLKKSTKITLNDIIPSEYSDSVKITGTFTAQNNTKIRLTPVVIEINGRKFKNITDDEGRYSFTYKVNKVGLNTVSVYYYGNNRFNAALNITNFNSTRKPTVISLDTIENKNNGKNITITGRYTDTDGKALRLTPLNLVINGNVFKVITDDNGTFTKNYSNKKDTITVELSYNGNQRYVGAKLSKSLYVGASKTNRIFKTRQTPVASVFVSGDVYQSHVDKWVKAGITDVYVRAKEAGNQTATLRKTISLCKNTNIKVHAWIIVFRDDQKWDHSPATQKKMKNFISSVMKINGVEGIVLDYIRYSGLHPDEVKPSLITNYVKEVNEMAKTYDKRMEVSCCIMPEVKSLEYYYGQDVQAMDKYCDYLVVMAYKNAYNENTQWMVDITKALKSKESHAKVVTSLATYKDFWGHDLMSVKEIVYDINAILKAGSYGYSIFSKSTTPVYPKIY